MYFNLQLQRRKNRISAANMETGILRYIIYFVSYFWMLLGNILRRQVKSHLHQLEIQEKS